jgi:hypothetical protein
MAVWLVVIKARCSRTASCSAYATFEKLQINNEADSALLFSAKPIKPSFTTGVGCAYGENLGV